MLGGTLQERLGLSRKQLQSIVQSRSTVNVWTGAVRSGKTVSSLLRWLTFVATAPTGGQLIMVGRTRESLARNVFAVLQDPGIFGELAKQCSYTAGASFGFILGRRVWVFGASDVRAEATLRGMTVAGVYGDECTLWTEDLWKTLLGRMSVDGAQLFGTTNPDNPRHWFKTSVVDRAVELQYRHFHFLLTDNQWLLNNNPGYVERIQKEYTGLYYRRFILGQWVQAEGAIYETWDVDRHVIAAADLPRIEHVYAVGCDHGTTNPTRAYALGIGTNPAGERRLYVIAEWAPQTGLTDAAQSVSMRRWLRDLQAARLTPEWVYVDPAAASFRTQLFADGIGNVAAASNDVLPGIRLVQSLLATGSLQVSDACTHLIDQLPGYVWDPKATLKGEDAPLKLDDHECLAFGTPILTSAGERPIETVRVGDRVWTRGGWRRVAVSRQTADGQWVRTFVVRLSNGETLVGTPDHPVFLADGRRVPIGELRYADTVWAWHSPSPTTAPVSAPTHPTARTTPPASPTGSAASSPSTERFGSASVDQSRPATTSTTGTATTTPPPTPTGSNASLQPSTPNVTPTTDASSGGRRSSWRTWLASALQRLSGMPHPKGAPGTLSTPAKAGRTGSRSKASATSADSRTSTTRRRGSARPDASPPTGERPASTTRRAAARPAPAGSWSTDTASLDAAPVHVVSVLLGPVVPVWNLAVDGDHEYVAAGVLVSNCDALRYAVYSSRHLWRGQVPLVTAAPGAPGADELTPAA